MPMPSLDRDGSLRENTMKASLRILAVFAALAAGTARADLTPGDHHFSIAFESLTREYDVHVPPGYDGSVPVPLVLDFHGYTSNPMEQASTSGLRSISNAEGFLIAYPRGYDEDDVELSWNAGICCPPAMDEGLDDVGLARAIVASIAVQANVDLGRVYATGLSNGGALSHRIACEAASTFAAVASVAAPLFLEPFSLCQPSRPVPVLHFAGLTDGVVPYSGGVSPVLPWLTVPSSPSSHAFWAATNDCTGSPTVESLPDGASCETYETCDGGAKVGFCSIHGTQGFPFLGHVLYSNTDGVNVGQRIWDFVSQFSVACECGDGALRPDCGEQCDDGNLADGDCCSSTCQAEPSASDCSDADLCDGSESCDGAGTCQAGTPLVCDDGDACTRDSCAPSSGCEADDAPATSCADAWEKGSLLVKESRPGKEKLVAKLVKGPALAQSDLGNPLSSGGTGYTLCVYDDQGALVGRSEVDRAGATCAGSDCWSAIGGAPPAGRGYLYKDASASADGITQLKLLGGPAGSSQILVKGGNDAANGETSLPTGMAAALSASTSATLQLFASDAPTCFSITLGDVKRQDATLFKAKHP
jgi:polyhydroxybutyrate depolymerase